MGAVGLMDITKQTFINSVREFLPWSQTHTGKIAARVYSLDASPFEPKAFAVFDAAGMDELKKLLACANGSGVSLTFRGSGTALSGQSIAEDAAVRFTGPGWHRLQVLDGGKRVYASNTVKGGEINRALAPFGRCITSDPSSIETATIGGMTANNAAGLSCTVPTNIYHTIQSMQFLLADGTYVDTADPESVSAFRRSHKGLLDGLAALRAKIFAGEGLAEKIRRKFRIRNTCGYSINAFVDYSDPVDILMHLLVGSEGTLAFIAGVVLETSPCKPFRGTTLVAFHTLSDAMDAMLRMRAACELYAGEFLDDISLRSLACLPGFPREFCPEGEVSDVCALLVETRAQTQDGLAASIGKLQAILDGYRLKGQLRFTTDRAECERLWDIRRALFPALAGTRLPSEYAYVEDCCVPIEHLPEACHGFVDIMRSLGFLRSGVNGHALHGNLHCTIPVDISRREEVEKLGEFVRRTVQLILKLDGSVKAEHGTGRAASSFVRLEWGDELYGIMKDAKKLLDPRGILNRGCLLTDDPEAYVHDLKQIGVVGHGVDLCVDCGFCEAVCPSARKGLSPRQRIYMLRAIASLKDRGRTAEAAEWEKAFTLQGRDRCATDGLCSTRCPLAIDVAGCVRTLRNEALTPMQRKKADLVRRHFPAAVKSASAMLNAWSAGQKLLGQDLAAKGARAVKAVTGMALPPARAGMTGSRAVPGTSLRSMEKIVYFPSCAVRTIGYADRKKEGEDLMSAAVRLIEKAGFEAVIPGNIAGLCCGKAFQSQGLFDQASSCARELNEVLLRATEGGRWPVMCDTSPCLAHMRETLDASLQLYEPVEFTLKYLVDKLKFRKQFKKIAVHATCSTRKMGLEGELRRAAALCAGEVIVPEGIFCCGFAGDKGFTHPDMNASVLAGLADAVADCEAGFSTSRTCEIGLTLHGRKAYRNILYLFDECSERREV